MTDLKLVVLDCDGVMFDSREANRAYYGHLRERFGRPPLTEEEVGFVHAHPAPESVPFIFREWPQDIERVNAYRAALDYTPFLRQMAIEPDLLEFLAAVRPPLLTAISTNRTSTMAAVLDTFGLRPHFDLVVTALDVERPKPHPEALLKILAALRRARRRRGCSSATPRSTSITPRRSGCRWSRSAARVSRPRTTSRASGRCWAPAVRRWRR